MKVIGYQKKDFKFDDGTVCPGINLFLSEERKGVTGVACERVSCSLNRLGSYNPSVGDIVQVLYNKFGKVESIQLMK